MQQPRRLTEGAVLSGIFVLILLLAVFIPFLTMFLIWVMPLPVIIFVKRHGWKAGMVMAVVMLLLSFFTTTTVGLPFAFVAAAGGITMGELMHRKKEALFVLTGSSIAYIGGLVVLYAGSVLLLDIDPLTVMQDLMRQSVQQAESMITSLGQDPSESLAQYNDMIGQLSKMGPVLIVFTGVCYALISQLIAHFVMRRLRMDAEAFPPLSQWDLPRSLLWYYLVVSVVYWVGVEEGTALEIVTSNLFPLLQTAMTLQGFTVVFYYCYSKSVPKVVPILIVIFGLVSPFVLLIARMLGIIDLGFQLKKRMESDTK